MKDLRSRTFSDVIKFSATWESYAELFTNDKTEGCVASFYIDSPNLILMGDTDSQRCDFEAVRESNISYTRFPWTGSSIFLLDGTMVMFIFSKFSDKNELVANLKAIRECLIELTNEFGVNVSESKNHLRTENGKRICMYSDERVAKNKEDYYVVTGVYYQIKENSFNLLDEFNNLDYRKWKNSLPSDQETSLEEETGRKIKFSKVDKKVQDVFKEKIGLKFNDLDEIPYDMFLRKLEKFDDHNWKRWGGVSLEHDS